MVTKIQFQKIFFLTAGFLFCSVHLQAEKNLTNRELSLWATYYFIHDFKNDTFGIPVRNKDGKVLGPRLKKEDWCKASLEGVFRVFFNGKWELYTYHGKSADFTVDDCDSPEKDKIKTNKFIISSHKFGLGTENIPLIPFRTIAVDPGIIPIGSIIFIPEAKGIEIKNNNFSEFTHDGYFFAGDRGSSISGNHIDVFFGNVKKNPFSVWLKSDSNEPFRAFLIQNQNTKKRLFKKFATFQKTHEKNPTSVPSPEY